MDTTTPAAVEASLDTAAPQVTTQTTIAEQTSPQAETPAGTEQEATASDTPEKEDQSQDESKKTWKEKRQERNRERWQEFKAAKDYTIKSLEAEVQRLRAKTAPDLSNIIDPDDVIAEKTAWKIQQSSVAEKEQALQVEREARAVAQQQALNETWQDVIEDARTRLPDFDAVVTDKTPIHARAAPFIVESEKAADLAYFLGKNPKEAAALYDQFETAPAKALIELGKLEARLSAPKAKTVSTAPKPAPTLSGGANPVAFDMSRASVEDVAAQLRKSGFIR
jgi:hypothetical protein